MGNESKAYYKPQYKCGVCGTIHESVADRMKCESECLKKQEEETKKAAEAKKLEEKDARYAEIKQLDAQVRDLDKKLQEKLHAYLNDYGSIQLEDEKTIDNGYFSILNKLLGWYW